MRKLKLFVAFQLIVLCLSAEYLKLAGEPRTIRGYTNQALPIDTPFSRSFKVTASTSENMEHISFQPNHLHLVEQGKLFLGGHNKNLLQSLRSAYADQYRQILVFDEYVLVLKGMNEVLVLEETATGFDLKHRFEIQEINYGTLVYRAYPFKQKALLFSASEIFLLSNKGYYSRLKYQSDDRGMVAHAEWIQGTDYVMVAEYAEGLAFYRIDEANNATEHVTTFDAAFFNQSAISVQDMSLRQRSDNKLYVLDRHFGILQVDFNVDNPKQSKYLRHVSEQQNCYSMDTLNRTYFVLSCSYETENYLLEVLLNENNTATSLKPLFKDEFIVDVEVAADYYLSLSRKMVAVYWNSQKNHLPEEFRQASNLVVPGTEIISLVSRNNSHYLYLVADNQLVKYLLEELPPKIEFRSERPIEQQHELSVYGSCAHLNKTVYSKVVPATDQQFCVYTAQYTFSVSELHAPNSSDVSASISVVIILLVVLLMLIWVCLKKYRKLESEARRMLDEFKNRTNKGRFGI